MTGRESGRESGRGTDAARGKGESSKERCNRDGGGGGGGIDREREEEEDNRCLAEKPTTELKSWLLQLCF